MSLQCHKIFKVMTSVSSADWGDFGPSCTGHQSYQSCPVYCETPQYLYFLCPNPGCSLEWCAVSSSGSWSPSLLFYWCLYAGGCIHTSRWWPPIFLSVLLSHRSNKDCINGELLEVTSSQCCVWSLMCRGRKWRERPKYPEGPRTE